MSGSGTRPERLNEADVALVLRRAAELDGAEHRPDASGIEVAALEEAAREVGISEGAVRRAVTELRADVLPVATSGRVERHGPATVRAERLVTFPSGSVRDRLGKALRKETFRLRRTDPERATWERRSDTMAEIRRGLDLSGRLKLGDARLVTVTAVAVPDGSGTLVCLEADIRRTRNGVLTTSTGVPAVLAATGAGALALIDPLFLLSAPPLTAGAGYAGLRAGAGAARRRAERTTDALHRLLDHLGQPLS